MKLSHLVAAASLCLGLISCAPEFTNAREADDPIVWLAPMNELEQTLLRAIKAFDPSLAEAHGQELGNNREIVARGLEQRSIIVLLGEFENGTQSMFDVLYINRTPKTPQTFAAKLEQALVTACDQVFKRVN